MAKPSPVAVPTKNPPDPGEPKSRSEPKPRSLPAHVKTVVWVRTLFALALLASSPAAADEIDLMTAEMLNPVVQIRDVPALDQTARRPANGAGFILTSDCGANGCTNIIATAFHLIISERGDVRNDMWVYFYDHNESQQGDVVGKDPDGDIALLRVTSRRQHATVNKIDELSLLRPFQRV